MITVCACALSNWSSASQQGAVDTNVHEEAATAAALNAASTVALEMVNAMQADGLEWGAHYRPPAPWEAERSKKSGLLLARALR
jgi:hypothetical protein